MGVAGKLSLCPHHAAGKPRHLLSYPSHPRRLGGDERKKSEKRGFRIFSLRGGRLSVGQKSFSSRAPDLMNLAQAGLVKSINEVRQSPPPQIVNY